MTDEQRGFRRHVARVRRPRRSGAGSRAAHARLEHLGAHARGRVRRPQRCAREQGLRLLLPADHRGRRLRGFEHPHRDLQQRHPPARRRRSRAGDGEGSVRVRRSDPACDRGAGPDPHVLLRELVHDRVATSLSPGLAAAAGQEGRVVHPRADVAALRPDLPGRHGRAARLGRRRSGSRALRGDRPGGGARGVGVHLVVHARRPGARACADPDRHHHRCHDDRLRDLGVCVDVEPRDEERGAVRVLRRRARRWCRGSRARRSAS